MIVASKTLTTQITTDSRYPVQVNAAVVKASGGHVPCYAIFGKRVPFKWVSVGSSAVIGRGEAARMLGFVGVDIAAVEAV